MKEMTQYHVGALIIAISAVFYLFSFAHLSYGFGVWGGIVSFLFLLLWLASLALGFLILERGRFGFGVAGAIGALSLLFMGLSPGIAVWMFGGSIIFTVFLLWAYVATQQEKELVKRVKIARIAKRSMPKVATGLIVMLAIFYGFTAADVLQQDDVEIVPLVVLEVVFTPISIVIESSVPEYQDGMSVGELQGLINRLLPTRQSIVLVDDPETLAQSVPVFLHGVVNESLRTILTPYRGVAPIFLVLGIFFVFKAMSVPIIWLALATVWLLKWALLRGGALKIQKTPTEEERLILNS